MRTFPSKSDLQATTERLAAYQPGEKLTLVLPVSGVRYNCTVTVPHTGAALRACIKVTEVRTNAELTVFALDLAMKLFTLEPGWK
jgi:hypothetical protein